MIANTRTHRTYAMTHMPIAPFIHLALVALAICATMLAGVAAWEIDAARGLTP